MKQDLIELGQWKGLWQTYATTTETDVSIVQEFNNEMDTVFLNVEQAGALGQWLVEVCGQEKPDPQGSTEPEDLAVELASAVDLVNTWLRERGLPEVQPPHARELRVGIRRLWDDATK